MGIADATPLQQVREMERDSIGEEGVNSSLREGVDLYVKLRDLRKHVEFLDVQEDYIKVGERGKIERDVFRFTLTLALTLIMCLILSLTFNPNPISSCNFPSLTFNPSPLSVPTLNPNTYPDGLVVFVWCCLVLMSR